MIWVPMLIKPPNLGQLLRNLQADFHTDEREAAWVNVHAIKHKINVHRRESPCCACGEICLGDLCMAERAWCLPAGLTWIVGDMATLCMILFSQNTDSRIDALIHSQSPFIIYNNYIPDRFHIVWSGIVFNIWRILLFIVKGKIP